MLLSQFIQIAKLQATHQTRIYASRILTLGTQSGTAITLAGYAGRQQLRSTVRAYSYTVSATDTQSIVMQNSAILCLVHSTGRTSGYAGRIFTVVAGTGIMVDLSIRIYASLVRFYLTEHHAYIQTVLILTGHLTGTAASANRIIKIKS